MKIKDKECPVCKGFNTTILFERYDVPVHQNYIIKEKEEAINAATGDLVIHICKDCGFVFNGGFDDSKLRYGSYYDNTQDLSALFQAYIESEIKYLNERFELKGKKVVEIGCGKGSFIKRLVEETGCCGIGFDPSYIGEDNLSDGKLSFIKEFYNEKYNELKADFIVCRHVIEHISDPITLLESINKTLKNSENPICFFETPSVRWIFKNKVLYDFFYEHCSYFDEISIEKAFEQTGFNVIEMQHRFFDQYLWVAAEVNKFNDSIPMDKKSEALVKSAFEYSKDIDSQISFWKDKLLSLNKEGKVAVWGAGAKGVTFVNILDPKRKWIDSLIDINKSKQGCFVPKTAHEIINYKSIPERDIRNIIIMNNNYLNEIRQALTAENIDVKLIVR